MIDLTRLIGLRSLEAILAEVRYLSAEFDRFKKAHNDFAVRTTNEIDELFAKVDARVQGQLGRKYARSGKGGHLLKW